MTTCLDDLIGVYCPEGVANTDSPQYYLSELPGINLAGAAQTADHEAGTGEGLMNKAITFAKKIVVRDFIQRLRKDQLLLEVLDQEKIGRHGTNFVGNVAQDTGVQFTKYDPDDRFTFGFLEYIEMKIEADAAGTTINWQIDNQDSVSTMSVDLVKGYNRVELKLSFNERVRVWIDTTAVSLSDGDEGFTDVYSRDCLDKYCFNYCGGCMAFKSISSPVGAETWTETNTFNGIVGFVQCKGDAEELVCIHAEELATAVLYRAGSHLMQERVASSRSNPFVRNTQEEAKELLVQWSGGIDALTGFQVKGEYPRALQQVVENAIQTARRSNSRAFKPTAIFLGDATTSSRAIRSRRRFKNLLK